MSVNLTVNGVAYPFPQTGDQNWGDQVTAWATAVTSGMLQKAGGTFTLTADVNFGPSFGVLSAYFTSVTASAAAAGAVRLAKTDTISFRNNANSGDLPIGINASDQLTFNGSTFVTSAGAITANRALASNGAGAIISSAVLDTELAFVAGLTSSAVAINKVQTLTNKTQSDSTSFFGAVGDISKLFKFDVSPITTATTRTFAVPDANTTLVGIDTTQTLTNKTINASSNTLQAIDSSNDIWNVSIAASVATNALTVSLVDKSGSAFSATNKGFIGFRSATAATGTYTPRSFSAAPTPIVIPSTTTIGTSSGVTTPIYVFAIDNAGTVELALSLSPAFDEGSVLTTTAISGGSSAITLYSTTARTGVAVRLLGRIISNQATAGTWASAPTEISNIPFRIAKQVVAGTAQTSLGSLAATSTYATPSNPPAVTIVPTRTGNYKVYGSFYIENATNGQGVFAKIVATVGTPTTIFNQEGAVLAESGTVPGGGSASPFVIVSLVSGTTYTFTLQLRNGGSGALNLRSDVITGGTALIAEEL